MKYKIVTSGKSKEVPLNKLSRNLKIHSEIYLIQDKEVYLGVISHKTLVFFSVEFAKYALQNFSKKIIPEAETCIRLTRKWLEDQESVSNEKLKAAADAAYVVDAANTAAYAAANAAANAAYAAEAAADAAAAAAAAHAAHAAYAAAYATADDYAAARAAADAAGENKNQEYERQGTFILDFLKTGNHLFLV